MRDHSPTARHPSTQQSRSTAARKRRQIQALTARLIAESMAKFMPIAAPALMPVPELSLLDRILAAHTVRRI